MQPKSVGAIIRATRQSHGWTQAKLHLVSGTNLADISRIETGRLQPTSAQLKKLATALQIPRTALVGDDGQ